MYIYMYVYMYIHICVYIYIYIYKRLDSRCTDASLLGGLLKRPGLRPSIELPLSNQAGLGCRV